MNPTFVTLRCWLFLVLGIATLHAADTPVPREWTVNGVTREALVYVPPHATTQPTPLLFSFHGHGGTMRNSARTWSYHTLWPDAVVVYPQGLPTVGLLTDTAGRKAGWQSGPGREGDRDLAFVDAMLASLRKEYRIDDHRIYATGFSNGGLFTYVLWAARGDQFAAFAPAGAVTRDPIADWKPKPVFVVAGRNDPLVRFNWQQRMLTELRQLNHGGPAQPADHGCVRYASDIGAPIVTYFHSGRHELPPAALPLIVAFLQQHAKP